jgi:hypothetical protein
MSVGLWRYEAVVADEMDSKGMRWAICSQPCSIEHSCRRPLMAGEVSFGESELDTRGSESPLLTRSRFGAGPPVLISEFTRYGPC